eukprot:IDg18529t1
MRELLQRECIDYPQMLSSSRVKVKINSSSSFAWQCWWYLVHLRRAVVFAYDGRCHLQAGCELQDHICQMTVAIVSSIQIAVEFSQHTFTSPSSQGLLLLYRRSRIQCMLHHKTGRSVGAFLKAAYASQVKLGADVISSANILPSVQVSVSEKGRHSTPSAERDTLSYLHMLMKQPIVARCAAIIHRATSIPDKATTCTGYLYRQAQQLTTTTHAFRADCHVYIMAR